MRGNPAPSHLSFNDFYTKSHADRKFCPNPVTHRNSRLKLATWWVGPEPHVTSTVSRSWQTTVTSPGGSGGDQGSGVACDIRAFWKGHGSHASASDPWLGHWELAGPH